jgi:transposase InsO family protein
MIQERVTNMTLQQKIISNKLGLLNLAQELGNVSKACKVMGLSRDTFYRYRELMETGGLEALNERSRRVPNIKNRTDEKTEAEVLKMASEQPAMGQHRVSNELRKVGVFISSGGVRSIWLRHNVETFQKRLAVIDREFQNGRVLTEAQLQALEKKKTDDEACGEIETHHPGYLGSQDTFYVGHIKGIGRIYQQTFVDTYSKFAHCKLYTTKTPIAAAELLNDRVVPFFESHGLFLLRMLTDRGTEYCGKAEKHDYQLFLAIHDIDHTKTKARHPQTNGICERFHKTILNEFYQSAFRKKLYKTIDELQTDLDEWLEYYNERRTHQGKNCNGRTPMETFVDGIKVFREKAWQHNQELH